MTQIEQLNNIFIQIRKDLQYNQLEGYSNLIYLYYNILQANDTELLNIYNSFIKELFQSNIIVENNIDFLRKKLLSSKCYSTEKISYKEKLFNERIIPSGLRRYE